jgi:hypothetical protein
MPDETQPVEVYNPQGKFGVIPPGQVEKAKAAGYKLKSDFVEVVHPKTGQTGIIPKDQWGDDKKPGAAQTQGFVMSPREQQRIKAKTGTPIQQAKTNYDALALASSPSGADPHNPGNPNLAALPADMRESVSTGLAATQAGGLAGELFLPTNITKAGPLVPTGRDAAGRFLPWAASKVTAEGPSLARQGVSGAVSVAKNLATWLKANPVKALAVETLAHEMGVDPIQLAQKVFKYGKEVTHVP